MIDDKKNKDNKNSINSAVARVSGAVRVANASVAKTIEIKNEAIDEVESLKTKSDSKAGAHAVKKIKTDTKKVSKK